MVNIEKRKPTKEFYSMLDEVVNHQVKSREAFDRAIEIARKQNFGDFEIGLFIKEYLRDKIPKTSLYRYIKELNPVPLEQIYYNNVLVEKDPTSQELIKEIVDEYKKFENETKVFVSKAVDLLEQMYNLGEWEGPLSKAGAKIKHDLRKEGIREESLELIDEFLPSKYKDY
jgi:hypothetical protein